MISAGFANDMIILSRSNRNALKEGCIYKNFDRECITSSIISRKPPVFKQGSPKFLLEIRKHLKEENQRTDHLKIQLLITSTAIVAGLLTLFFL